LRAAFWTLTLQLLSLHVIIIIIQLNSSFVYVLISRSKCHNEVNMSQEVDETNTHKDKRSHVHLNDGYSIAVAITSMMRPPLWSRGQSSWLQIQRSGFDSRRYQIFWEIVDLERGPLSLMSRNEELRGRKSSGCGL
jgi:hypothetical protein